MCTVTYFPTENGSIITASRDEAPSRNADGLVPYSSNSNQSFLIAKEPLHGGTNLAIGSECTSILLNGAFTAHKRKLTYQKSRGILLLETLDLPALDALFETDVEGVEPFTLLRFGKRIEEVRWDGLKIHHTVRHENEPFIVASAKLYTPEVLEKRQLWFEKILSETSVKSGNLMKFHLQGGDGDKRNDMVMNRDNLVRTVSVTQINQWPDQKSIEHRDLVNRRKFEFKLSLKQN